ncbi:MAG TPA: hypothetical protein VLJ10_01645 [Candidatus Bathyarchaeia archaeon]|nr:hypothetical protein [Candidatus Bathyarchaeia archaeon]
MRKKIKALLGNTFHIVLLAAVCLVIPEGVLRLTRPDLKFALEAEQYISKDRLFWNPRHTAYFLEEPDRQDIVLVMHNDLGMRQHRNFSVEKKPGTVRIGIFGDSYAENLRVNVQYSFSEVMDYLFNRIYGEHFEVMNFGTEGYATDQSYQQYLDEGRRLGLDAAFYLFSADDLWKNLANEHARREFDSKQETGLWNALKPHSYLVNVIEEFFKSMDNGDDAPQILSYYKRNFKPSQLRPRLLFNNFLETITKEGERNPEVRLARDTFISIIGEWGKKANQDSATFVIGFVPRKFAVTEWIQPAICQQGVAVMSLFSEWDPLWKTPPDEFFQKSLPWNEEGNKHAAVHFFKKLARELNYPETTDQEIAQALYEYYSSFSGYDDMISPSWLNPIKVNPDLNNRILLKYLALEKK